MYKEWLDEDQEDIEMSEDEIKELQSQLLEVKDKLGAKSSVLSSQEETLNDKDSRLTVRLCLLIDAYSLPALSRHTNSRSSRSSTCSTRWPKSS